MKHANIPVFVPHVGCPNDCAFCNQRTISGKVSFSVDAVKDEIDGALGTIVSCVPQIAFFGGSFTGIERPLMIQLLEIANEYIEKGLVDSVRLSTRPDYINEELLEILKRYNVKNIELGIQSMNDKVLKMNKRGHTADDSRKAMALISQYGFGLTGQMMTGMYTATPEDEIYTAKEICKYADSARIYPTITFKDTLLAKLYENGEYIPPTLDETIERGAAVYRIFKENDVDVIRIGLQSGEGLHSDKVCAGEYHDAIGELILSRVCLDELRERRVTNEISNGTITYFVPKKLLSQYIGQKRKNVNILEKELGIKVKIKVAD